MGPEQRQPHFVVVSAKQRLKVEIEGQKPPPKLHLQNKPFKNAI
jgi:hypothetical protein